MGALLIIALHSTNNEGDGALTILRLGEIDFGLPRSSFKDNKSSMLTNKFHIFFPHIK